MESSYSRAKARKRWANQCLVDASMSRMLSEEATFVHRSRKASPPPAPPPRALRKALLRCVCVWNPLSAERWREKGGRISALVDASVLSFHDVRDEQRMVEKLSEIVKDQLPAAAKAAQDAARDAERSRAAQPKYDTPAPPPKAKGEPKGKGKAQAKGKGSSYDDTRRPQAGLFVLLSA